MKEPEEKLPPLEAGLRIIMDALNSQVAREMQRDEAARMKLGERKAEPILKRVERVSAFVLDEIATQPGELDALIILSQSFAKALVLVTEDLGEEGLGKMRTEYFLDAARQIESDMLRIKAQLRPDYTAN